MTALGRRLGFFVVLVFAAGCTAVGDPVPGAPAHHREYGFANPSGAKGTDAVDFLLDRLRLAFSREEEFPAETLTAEAAAASWAATGEADAVQWLGHATLRLRLAGQVLIVDPVFAERVTPLPPFGPPRAEEAALSAADLHDVGIVLISHDHYDHFEPETVNLLAAREGTRCFLPLKVAAGEGVVCDLAELDWYDSVEVDGLTITFLPSQHESGRGIFDRDRSLWGAWLVEGPAEEGEKRVYISGDGGYAAHFAELGESLDSLDLAAISVGGYEPDYNSGVHMNPVEAIRTIEDLRAERAIIVHWGTYPLGLESGGETVERVTAAAEEAGIGERILFLKIGEAVRF